MPGSPSCCSPAGVGLGAVALAPGTRWGRALALFGFAAALGCGLIWWKAERAAAPRLERERMMELTATVESVQALAAAERRSACVVRPLGEGLPVRLRVNVDEDKIVPGLAPGATVQPARLADAAGADGRARRL